MQISSRFTVAVHTLLAIDTFEKEYKTTSEFLASSVNVNPVVIRRTLQSLKGAGFIGVKAGSGGAYLVRDPQEITLYDVYRAVDCGKVELFHFHENPNPKCLVGENIHAVLDQKLNRAQRNKRGLPRSFLSPQPTERTCFSNNKRGLPRSSLPLQPIGRTYL